jgi:signal transduction histidine kinase
MKLARLLGSLRFRLLAGTLVWTVASVLVAGWGLNSLFRQHVSAQFHAELESHLDQLTAQLTLDAQGHPQLLLALSDPRLSRPYSGYYWQIDRMQGNGGGNAVTGELRSRSLWDFVLAAPPDTPADGETHQHQAAGPEGKRLVMVERSVRTDEAPDGKPRTFRLIAAADEDFMSEPVARFSSNLWLALGLLAAGLMLAALVQVFVGLAPLRSLRRALGKLRSAQAQRLEGPFPLEVLPLIEEFNAVLAQNAEVIERSRTHAGNLAHALKTPLSVLANAAADQNLQGADLHRLVGEQVAIARRQVDYHLARAQVAATVRMPGARTPLHSVVHGLARAMRHIHAQREIELTVQPFPDALAFRGEAQDLQEMLGNLLDNACKWATRQVQLSATSDGATLTLLIDDDGPGLAAEQREAVVRRGVRADEQVPGSGLGLAIVDDLARIYQGRLELEDSPCGGLRARLTLPASH